MSNNRRRRVSIAPKAADPEEPWRDPTGFPDPEETERRIASTSAERVLHVGVAAAIGTLRHGQGTRAELQERARWQMLHAGLTAEMMLPRREEVPST